LKMTLGLKLRVRYEAIKYIFYFIFIKHILNNILKF
jgi:hypothetical protein